MANLDDDLLRRQNTLQAEARQIIADLNLWGALAHAGQPTLLGSVATGLMVWRDIDFNVSSPQLSLASALDVIQPLLLHPRVVALRYHSECLPYTRASEPEDDRYYFALTYRDAARDDWKIDISFWLAPQPREERLLPEAITARLTDETRAAILRIKDVWYRLPTYRVSVASVDIYDAVFDHGARTPEDFDRYLRAQGKPGRE